MMNALVQWWETNPITHLFFSFGAMKAALPAILKAFPVSLMFGFVAFLLAIPGGLLLSFMKMAKTRWLRWPATVYVDIVRGTPLFLQILLVFFGLPLTPIYKTVVDALALKQYLFLGVDATIVWRGLMVLSLNSAAYMCEIFRAGIQSIPKGQSEAARSLGMTKSQTMAFVILPQTIRRILPTMMSEFILLFKDTALLAAVSVAEMTLRAKEAAATSFNQSSYIAAACMYLLITIPLGRIVSRLENKLAVQDGGAAGIGKRPPRIDADGVDAEHVVPHKELVMGDQR